MDDLEKKRTILEQVGEEGLKILKDNGIDVDSAVDRILKEQQREQEDLEAQAEFGTVDDIMTSELVYRSTSLEDVYGKEFTRRLHEIDLTDEQISSLYQTEQLILSVDGNLSEDRKQPWVRRYLIKPDSTIKTMPEKGLLTLSELISITDDASSKFVRNHDTASEELFAAICMAAVQAHSYGGAQYAIELRERVEKFGWSKAQEGALTKNECLLTERLKWGYHDKPAWTPETCDLKQYER